MGVGNSSTRVCPPLLCRWHLDCCQAAQRRPLPQRCFFSKNQNQGKKERAPFQALSWSGGAALLSTLGASGQRPRRRAPRSAPTDAGALLGRVPLPGPSAGSRKALPGAAAGLGIPPESRLPGRARGELSRVLPVPTASGARRSIARPTARGCRTGGRLAPVPYPRCQGSSSPADPAAQRLPLPLTPSSLRAGCPCPAPARPCPHRPLPDPAELWERRPAPQPCSPRRASVQDPRLRCTRAGSHGGERRAGAPLVPGALPDVHDI